MRFQEWLIVLYHEHEDTAWQMSIASMSSQVAWGTTSGQPSRDRIQRIHFLALESDFSLGKITRMYWLGISLWFDLVGQSLFHILYFRYRCMKHVAYWFLPAAMHIRGSISLMQSLESVSHFLPCKRRVECMRSREYWSGLEYKNYSKR